MTVSQPGSPSEIDRSPPSLLGRGDELARLYRIVEELPDHGEALVVRGEPGIGKSALLAAASRRAQDRGVMVLAANGVESEAQSRLPDCISSCFRRYDS